MISNAISCSLVPFLHRMHFLNTTDHNPLKRLVRITYFRCHLFCYLKQIVVSELGKKHKQKGRHREHMYLKCLTIICSNWLFVCLRDLMNKAQFLAASCYVEPEEHTLPFQAARQSPAGPEVWGGPLLRKSSWLSCILWGPHVANFLTEGFTTKRLETAKMASDACEHLGSVSTLLCADKLHIQE